MHEAKSVYLIHLPTFNKRSCGLRPARFPFVISVELILRDNGRLNSEDAKVAKCLGI